jgi:very-short-patch-repair endonuclease
MNTTRFVKISARRMKKRPTKYEYIFRERLIKAEIAHRFQVEIGNYIADFLFPDKMLIVEIDGRWHEDPKQVIYDSKRTEVFEKIGYTVIRVKNQNVKDFSLETIIDIPNRTSKEYKKAIARAKNFRNVAFCTVCQKDTPVTNSNKFMPHGSRGSCPLSGKFVSKDLKLISRHPERTL